MNFSRVCIVFIFLIGDQVWVWSNFSESCLTASSKTLRWIYASLSFAQLHSQLCCVVFLVTQESGLNNSACWLSLVQTRTEQVTINTLNLLWLEHVLFCLLFYLSDLKIKFESGLTSQSLVQLLLWPFCFVPEESVAFHSLATRHFANCFAAFFTGAKGFHLCTVALWLF